MTTPKNLQFYGGPGRLKGMLVYALNGGRGLNPEEARAIPYFKDCFFN